MSGIVKAKAFARDREPLTGAGPTPDGAIVFPSGSTQGVAPDSDPGEEMALGKAPVVLWLDIDDRPFIHEPRRYVAGLDQIPRPLTGVGIDLVVDRPRARASSLRSRHRELSI